MGLTTELGKITKATFGLGGYQDAQVGLWLTFEGKGWGVPMESSVDGVSHQTLAPNGHWKIKQPNTLS